MTSEPPSPQISPPLRARQLIILVLGLCLAGLWAWRAGLLWRPSPAPISPQQKWFLQISGDLPRPGVHVFNAPPTAQEVWDAAGGSGGVPFALPPLTSGARLTIASDRTVALNRMPGAALLTLGLPLDPNQATAPDLEAVPGLGPVLAKRIVEFREERGPFRNIENLLAVKGMGPKILEKIRPYMVIIADDEKIP